jgi:hypothetical protein
MLPSQVWTPEHSPSSETVRVLVPEEIGALETADGAEDATGLEEGAVDSTGLEEADVVAKTEDSEALVGANPGTEYTDVTDVARVVGC